MKDIAEEPLSTEEIRKKFRSLKGRVESIEDLRDEIRMDRSTFQTAMSELAAMMAHEHKAVRELAEAIRLFASANETEAQLLHERWMRCIGVFEKIITPKTFYLLIGTVMVFIVMYWGGFIERSADGTIGVGSTPKHWQEMVTPAEDDPKPVDDVRNRLRSDTAEGATLEVPDDGSR